MSIETLHAALAATDLIEDLEVGEGFLAGDVTFAAAGQQVAINVDPDPTGEGNEVDDAVMVARTRELLALEAQTYGRILTEVADELEAALEEEGLERIDDIRGDLAPVALVVLPDEHGLVLVSPAQLPEASLTVILDNEFEITEIQLQGAEGGCGDNCACGAGHDDETVVSVDELIGSLSTEQ